MFIQSSLGKSPTGASRNPATARSSAAPNVNRRSTTRQNPPVTPDRSDEETRSRAQNDPSCLRNTDGPGTNSRRHVEDTIGRGVVHRARSATSIGRVGPPVRGDRTAQPSDASKAGQVILEPIHGDPDVRRTQVERDGRDDATATGVGLDETRLATTMPPSIHSLRRSHLDRDSSAVHLGLATVPWQPPQAPVPIPRVPDPCQPQYQRSGPAVLPIIDSQWPGHSQPPHNITPLPAQRPIPTHPDQPGIGEARAVTAPARGCPAPGPPGASSGPPRVLDSTTANSSNQLPQTGLVAPPPTRRTPLPPQPFRDQAPGDQRPPARTSWQGDQQRQRQQQQQQQRRPWERQERPGEGALSGRGQDDAERQQIDGPPPLPPPPQQQVLPPPVLKQAPPPTPPLQQHPLSSAPPQPPQQQRMPQALPQQHPLPPTSPPLPPLQHQLPSALPQPPQQQQAPPPLLQQQQQHPLPPTSPPPPLQKQRPTAVPPPLPKQPPPLPMRPPQQQLMPLASPPPQLVPPSLPPQPPPPPPPLQPLPPQPLPLDPGEQLMPPALSQRPPPQLSPPLSQQPPRQPQQPMPPSLPPPPSQPLTSALPPQPQQQLMPPPLNQQPQQQLEGALGWDEEDPWGSWSSFSGEEEEAVAAGASLLATTPGTISPGVRTDVKEGWRWETRQAAHGQAPEGHNDEQRGLGPGHEHPGTLWEDPGEGLWPVPARLPPPRRPTRPQLDGQGFMHQHLAALAALEAEKAAARKRVRRRRRQSSRHVDSGDSGAATAGDDTASAPAAAESGQIREEGPMVEATEGSAPNFTPEPALLAGSDMPGAESTEAAAGVEGPEAAGEGPPATSPDAGGEPSAPAPPHLRVCLYPDYELAQGLGAAGAEELEALGLSSTQLEEKLRTAAERRTAAQAAAAAEPPLCEDTGLELDQPMTAEEKAAFWARACAGGEAGPRGVPVMLCVRQPTPYGRAEVYELPDLGQGPMDEQTWGAWGALQGSNRPPAPLAVLEASGGVRWGFELFGARGEGGWRSFEVLVGHGYSHGGEQTLHPLRLVCGHRMATNARDVNDLLAFLRDPTREDVEAHLTHLALRTADQHTSGSRGHEGVHEAGSATAAEGGVGEAVESAAEETRKSSARAVAGGGSAEAGAKGRGREHVALFFTPEFCHRVLVRRWGEEGLAHVGWGPRDTLLHVRAARRNPNWALRRAFDTAGPTGVSERLGQGG